MKILRYFLMGMLVIVLLDLLITYIYFGRFLFRSESISESREVSRALGVMYLEHPEITVEGDSLENFKDEFDLWVDDYQITTVIGISPFHYSEVDPDRVVLHIRPLKEKRNWLISFNEKSERLRTPQSLVYKRGNSVVVHFYYNRNTVLTEFGRVVVREHSRKDQKE